MESIQVFTLFVLAMCGIHLAATTSAHLANWRDKILLRKNTLKGSAVDGVSRIGVLQETRAAQRGDWYVFFHCSDLTGRPSLPENSSSQRQEQSGRIKKTKPQTRRLTAVR